MVNSKNVVKVLVPFFVFCLAIFLLGSPVCMKAEASEKKEIKIGILGPMQFVIGKHGWYGASIAADEINAAGGVNVNGVTHRIELAKADTNEYRSVVDAVSAAEKLIISDKVDFLVGGHRTESTLAIQEVMAKHRIIFLGTGQAHPVLCARVAKDYDRYKYWFRLFINSRDFGQALYTMINVAGSAVRKELGIARPKVALMFERAKWTEPMAKAAPKMLEKMGMEYVGIWRPSMRATDVTAELTGIKAKGAHVICTAIAGPIGGILPKQWAELQIPTALTGISAMAQRQEHWDATGGKCNYQLTVNFINRIELTDKTIPFYDKFVKRCGKFPLFSADAYDAVYILKEAIERAGVLDNDAVVKELEKTDFKGVMGRYVFTKKTDKWPHDAKWGPRYITTIGDQWQDGKLVTVWPDGAIYPLDDENWKGIRFKGTADYKLPPWMIEYWKTKRK